MSEQEQEQERRPQPGLPWQRIAALLGWSDARLGEWRHILLEEHRIDGEEGRMTGYAAPAPDDVLDRILHRAVEPGNSTLPLDVFVQLGLGRDATADELRRMTALAEAGRRAQQDRVDLTEAALAVAESREAAGLPALDRDELEAAALARLGRAHTGR